MARKVVTHFIDDLDGSEAEGTVSFALEGVTYEIDLSSKNKDKLRKALQPYIDAGQRTGGRRVPSGSRGGRNDLAAIRKWAKENGYEVSERGRIPAAVMEAYDAAH